jgi:hypothetical protein
VRSDPTLPVSRIFAAGALKHAPVMAPVAVAEDLRSVGELLRDADHHARNLLLDVEPEAAPGRLRSWAATVTACVELLESFPGHKYPGAGDRRLVERVAELATSVQSDLATARWPGPGAGDHCMHAIDLNLTRARELVDRYGGDVPTHQPAVQKDLEAARTRVVHTLYLATHGVVVALIEVGRQRAAEPTRTEASRAGTVRQRGRYEVGPGVRWVDRLGVAERTLGSYLQGNGAQTLAYEQAAPVLGLPRLSDALARFDIQAHRTLVDAPAPGNLVLLTRTEGMFFGAALVLARATTETGHLDQAAADPERLERSLTLAGVAWSNLARRWRDLMPQGSRIDPALAAAAAQLRAACRELTHDHDQIADVAAIAQRVDLAAVLSVLTCYVDAAAELAEATRPPLRGAELVAPARAVVRRLNQDIDDGLLPDNSDALRSDLIAIAARSNQLGPVPVQILDGLHGATSKASRTSSAAASSIRTAIPHAPIRTAQGVGAEERFNRRETCDTPHPKPVPNAPNPVRR